MILTTIRKFLGIGDVLTLLRELGSQIGQVMSVISDFAARQKAFNESLTNSLSGIEGDIKSLNDRITELQNSPGEVTPEDQALLDALQVQGEQLASKFTELDNLTPPVVPPSA